MSFPIFQPEALAVIMLLLLTVAIMIGFPTAFTLMSLGIIFGFLGFGFLVFDLLVLRAFFVMRNDALIAVPVFLFMGYVIERAGILDRLFYSIQMLMGPLPGSLAIATLLTGTLFATATGIVGASVTLLGLLALPAMLKRKYDVEFAAGAVTASGTLGILIPPSVLLILYGFVAGVSVPRLYAAAFLPGFTLAGIYFVFILIRAWRNPKLGPPLSKEERTIPLPVMLRELGIGMFPIVALILAVLGVIFLGIATPTEAASMGAVAGLLLAALHRRLSFKMLQESVFLTIRAAAVVGWLILGSSLFAGVFARLGGSKLIGDFVLGLGLDQFWFFWAVQLVIFVLGWPLEWTEITIIFMPLFLPLLDVYKIDLVFFGVMAALNQQTSFLSPPVAMSAFYLKNVAPKHVTLNQIFRGMYPYLALQITAMIILYIFPDLALGLPRLLYDNK